MKGDVGAPIEPAAGHGQRLFRRIDAMELADPRRDPLRPAARSAAEIEALGIGRQLIEREQREITAEQFAIFGVGQAGLIERRPFLAETFDGSRIDVWLAHGADHLGLRDGGDGAGEPRSAIAPAAEMAR